MKYLLYLPKQHLLLQRCEQIFVVLLIAVGLFMFTYESTQFSLIGFCLVLLASFLSGLRWTLSQIVLQKGEIGIILGSVMMGLAIRCT